jgi:hypothetical protein
MAIFKKHQDWYDICWIENNKYEMEQLKNLVYPDLLEKLKIKNGGTDEHIKRDVKWRNNKKNNLHQKYP